jgi:hypothetical protein
MLKLRASSPLPKAFKEETLEYEKAYLTHKKLQKTSENAETTKSDISSSNSDTGFMKFVDKTTLYMNLVITSSMISFYLFAPFLPLEIERMKYDTKKIGFIMSIYSVFNFITSCLLGKILPYFSKRKFLLAVLIVMGSTMVMFAML